MNLESMKKLHLDLRLQRRRGWIAQSDLDAELAGLPDVSDKIHVSEDESDAEPAAAPGAAEEAAPASAAGVAPAGSTPTGGGV